MYNCEYIIKLNVELKHSKPPKDAKEEVFRGKLQNHLNKIVDDYLQKTKNRQNLMNTILGNTGILIPNK